MQRSNHLAEGFSPAYLPLQVARLWQQQIVSGIEMGQRLNERLFAALPFYFEGPTDNVTTPAVHRSPTKRRRSGNGAARPKRQARHRKSH